MEPTPEKPAGTSGMILDRFASLCETAPEAMAMLCAATGERTSRHALLERSHRIAQHLRECGLAEGHAVATQLANGVDFVATFLATRILGLTFVPIDRDAKETEIAAVMQQFALNALVYQPGIAEALPFAIVRSGSVNPSLAGVALLKLTSGSTGRPKGILTSEANLVADCDNICASMAIEPHDRNFGAIPFSHSYGFSNLVTPLVLQGTAVVFSNDYLPLAIIEACNRYDVTVMPGIPLIYEHLARLPQDDGMFGSVRTFISAGAPLAASTSRMFRERHANSIHTFYGCSECGGITYDRDGAAVETGSVGSAIQGVTLRSEGEQGRLQVTSGAVASGYFDPAGDECLKFGAGSFLTDDVVSIDGNGIVQITGRIGDFINTAGKKVNPREIEAVIMQIDGVEQVKVYGEAAGARGEVVAAAVVAAPNVSREMIRTHCRALLSAHKVPRIVKLIESIPVDERGKVKRSLLAAL